MIRQKISDAEKEGKFKELKKESITQESLQRILAKCARNIHGDYILQTTGDVEVDKYRDIVLGIFTKQHTVTKGQIDDACTGTFHQKMPAKIYAKVMRQLAYFKNSKWTFKGAPPAETEEKKNG